MNKNFEIEYKKYADSAVPDLWSRIEAGVDAYENSIKNRDAGSEETKTDKIVNIEDYNRKSEDDIKHDTEVKKTRKWNYKPYLGVITAVACMFLVVVVMKNVISSSNSMTSAESAAAPAAMDSAPAAEEAAPAEAMEEAAPAEAMEEAAPAEAMEEAAEAASDEAAPVYEAEEAAETAEAEETLEAEDAADNMLNADGRSYITGGTNTRSASKYKNEAAKISTDEIMLSCTIDDPDGLDDGTVFTARITDPMDTALKADDEIKVRVNDNSAKSLSDVLTDSRSNEYTLILKPENDGIYTLVSAEIKK